MFTSGLLEMWCTNKGQSVSVHVSTETAVWSVREQTSSLCFYLLSDLRPLITDKSSADLRADQRTNRNSPLISLIRAQWWLKMEMKLSQCHLYLQVWIYYVVFSLLFIFIAVSQLVHSSNWSVHRLVHRTICHTVCSVSVSQRWRSAAFPFLTSQEMKSVLRTEQDI